VLVCRPLTGGGWGPCRSVKREFNGHTNVKFCCFSSFLSQDPYEEGKLMKAHVRRAEPQPSHSLTVSPIVRRIVAARLGSAGVLTHPLGRAEARSACALGCHQLPRQLCSNLYSDGKVANRNA
jgi:hypothetical protein